MARVTSDFWVAAYLRRLNRDGVAAVLRRRGAAEAGAILVKLDCLDGRAALFGPAPSHPMSSDPSPADSAGGGAGGRRFLRLHRDEWIDPAEAEARLARAVGFDADLWIVEVENRAGDPTLDVVAI